MTAACATLASVTDVDPSTARGAPTGAPALSAEDLVRLTGGRLLATCGQHGQRGGEDGAADAEA